VREVGRRLNAAWAALRHGTPAVPGADMVTVPIPELRDLVERSLAVVNLPYDWANDASTDEIEVAGKAIDLALHVRRGEWAHVEAGGWPTR